MKRKRVGRVERGSRESGASRAGLGLLNDEANLQNKTAGFGVLKSCAPSPKSRQRAAPAYAMPAAAPPLGQRSILRSRHPKLYKLYKHF